MRAASCVLLTSNRNGCCSECRCMSPFASPMERSRTPGNTETAIFDLEVETGRWRSHPTTHCSMLEAGWASAMKSRANSVTWRIEARIV